MSALIKTQLPFANAAKFGFPPLAPESSIYPGYSDGFPRGAVFLIMCYFQRYRRFKYVLFKEILLPFL